VTPLPLFPLGTVLFPGLVLPLHVFEERYRALMRHLMDRPEGEPREFGVVAIEKGLEVAQNDVRLYPVGCTAEVRQVTERDDGELDVVTVGRRRFEIEQMVAADTPYLIAEVRYLPEPPDPDGAADRLAPGVLAVFRRYLRLIQTGGGRRADGQGAGRLEEQLPDDPTVLSHLIAATAALSVADRQRLLAAPDTAARLRAELSLLSHEVALLNQVRAVPVSPSDLPVRPGPN
jgi:Lon protease-like protein